MVLSLSRMRDLEPVDTAAGEVTVAAGATLGALQEHVRRAGFGFGVDLGARDSATIGGMVATNAGGMQVFRHGPMRAQLVGIEAVTADGSVLRRLPGLVKDNTGYHLPSLAGRQRGHAGGDHPRAAAPGAAAVAPGGGAAGGRRCRLPRWRWRARSDGRLPNLLAAELFFDDGMTLVLSHAGGDRPFREPHPAYLLVEADGATDPSDALVEAIERRTATWCATWWSRRTRRDGSGCGGCASGTPKR